MVNAEWAEKYRPQSLKEVIGNPEAISNIRKWAEEWTKHIPPKKSIVFEGRAGIGKTTTALALAQEYGWGVIELNASDARNETVIKNIALQGAISETFKQDGTFVSTKKGMRKLIIFDEADNLYEREGGEYGDTGGKKAIVETIKNSSQPIILIVNDPYELFKGTNGAIIKNLSLEIKFRGLNYKQIASKILKPICVKENIKIDDKLLEQVASRNDGDVRAAINDLELISLGNKTISNEDLKMVGWRDKRENIYSATMEILRTMSFNSALDEINNLDEDPETLLFWLDENLPLEYKKPEDLVRGMESLSKADIFLGRVSKRQYYRLWAYAINMMAAVSIAKKERYSVHFPKYNAPQLIRKFSLTKKTRELRTLICRKIGKYMHLSSNKVSQEIFEEFKIMFQKNSDFKNKMVEILSLSDDETDLLLKKN